MAWKLPWIMHKVQDLRSVSSHSEVPVIVGNTIKCMYADTNDIQTTGSLVPGAPRPAFVACSMKQTKAGCGGLGTRVDYWYLATSIALKTPTNCPHIARQPLASLSCAHLVPRPHPVCCSWFILLPISWAGPGNEANCYFLLCKKKQIKVVLSSKLSSRLA